MGYVKRKFSTSVKISMACFDESKEIFMADVVAEVLFYSIPQSLTINWLVHCSNWRLDNGEGRCVDCTNCPQ